MSERSMRKKNTTGEKEIDTNQTTNASIIPSESLRNQGPNQIGQGNSKDSGSNQNQGDSEKSKNLGSNLLTQDQRDLDLSKNLGPSEEEPSKNQKEVDKTNNNQNSETGKAKNVSSGGNPVIIKDLADDQESNTSNEMINANLLEVNNAFKQVPVMKKSSPKKAKQKSVVLERSISEGQIINQAYVDSLKSIPQNCQSDSVIIESNGEFDSDVDLTDKNAVFKKAMSLTLEGDSHGAAKYLKVYEALGHLDLGNQRPSTKRATSANPVLNESSAEVNKNGGIFENGMWFFPDRTTNYQNRSYTPYFDRNIKELRYPIPLTIFDKDWQNRAMGYHAKKKVKSIEGELKSESYTGLPYADEWLLDYGDWSIHYNGYINALKNAKFTRFVDWSLAHKLNVERVMLEMGWLTALKYDMRVREEALVNRTEIDGFVAPPNISIFNAVLAEECYQGTRSRNETLFSKNPYVEGGERHGWDPATGKPPKKTEKSVQNKPYQKWNNQTSNNNTTNSSASGSGTIPSGNKPFEKKKFQRGYLGNNFDENYKDKQAAAIKNKQVEK